MSTIDLATLEAISGALSAMNYSASASDLVKFLEHIDGEGFIICRKISFVDPPPEPNSEPTAPAVQWPPRALGTKLWATNMGPEREKIYPVFSLAELKRVTEQGASLIEASSESDARTFWEARSSNDEASFSIDGTNYRYIMDQIPF